MVDSRPPLQRFLVEVEHHADRSIADGVDSDLPSRLMSLEDRERLVEARLPSGFAEPVRLAQLQLDLGHDPERTEVLTLGADAR